MNIIDLIVCLVLVLAVWSGWRQGFIMQIFSLAGLVAGIWLAAHYGETVGGWLRLDEDIATPVGFIVVLLIVVLVVAIVGRAIRKLFHFAGLGVTDIVLGVIVAVAKYLLVLSVAFAVLDALNEDYTLVKAQTIETSKSYKPIMRLSKSIFPFLEWIGQQVPQKNE